MKDSWSVEDGEAGIQQRMMRIRNIHLALRL